jgi:FO synthase
METAHRVGLQSTATIMYGHVDRLIHWARHLLHIRDLQSRSGGFTEFVPLPFVAQEAPIYLKGKARHGPTLREAVLMHAVARLVLHPQISNIQTSWVKMGAEGVKLCLNAGANDLGGTLMNETITRSAGATHGQEMPPEAMETLIRKLGREPLQRTTLYRRPPPDQSAASYSAVPLQQPVNTPARRYERITGSGHDR